VYTSVLSADGSRLIAGASRWLDADAGELHTPAIVDDASAAANIKPTFLLATATPLLIGYGRTARRRGALDGTIHSNRPYC